MQRYITYFLACILLISCSKEKNFLRYSASPNLQQFIPDYKSPKKFIADNGDTISFSLIDSISYYEKTTYQGNSPGNSIGEFEQLEEERIAIIIGSNQPYYRFTFSLKTHYNPNVLRQSADHLQIDFHEIYGRADANIQFDYTDTLICSTPRCAQTDTLNFKYNTFYNAYYTRRDSISNTAIYVNNTRGLIGFKTSDNRIFELIP